MLMAGLRGREGSIEALNGLDEPSGELGGLSGLDGAVDELDELDEERGPVDKGTGSVGELDELEELEEPVCVLDELIINELGGLTDGLAGLDVWLMGGLSGSSRGWCWSSCSVFSSFPAFFSVRRYSGLQTVENMKRAPSGLS